jgi:phosphoglycolate phosphatase
VTRGRLPVVLVDLDGTVLKDRAGRPSMLRAVREVAGRDASDDDRLSFAGRTDAWVARELLRRAGHAESPDAVRRVHARYLALLGEALARDGCVATPGALALGAALAERAASGRAAPPLLLTGNLREGARRKLAAAGLSDAFPLVGAFGDEREDRDDLARDAYAMAPACAPVVLGDAPADVRAARAIGARVVVVATGPVPREALLAERPDALLDGLADTEEVLAALFPRVGYRHQGA